MGAGGMGVRLSFTGVVTELGIERTMNKGDVFHLFNSMVYKDKTDIKHDSPRYSNSVSPCF